MPAAVSQIVTRASVGFVLDQVRLGRGPLDFVDALILMAVSQANVEPVLRDPELNRAYATYEAPPPESLRRPVSLNGIAQSLGIPFETVRRRVMRLAKVGIFKVAAEGVTVPGWVVQLGAHRTAAEAAYKRVQDLHGRLLRLGAVSEPPPSPRWEGSPPIRAVTRTAAEYLLRLVASATAELGDLASVVVWFEVLRASHEHLPDQAGLCIEESRPVTITALAQRIGMPAETIRRRVSYLAAQGVCERQGRGVVLGPQTLARPALLDVMVDNHLNLRRLFVALDRLGVTGAWVAEGRLVA